MKDVIVIGQGPSGISCAIYLKRFNLNPIVIAKDFGALETKATIENYYGIESIDGKELIQKGIDQAKKLGIEVINEEVISIENYGTFEVITNKNKYEGKAVYLAVGKAKAKLNKKGLKEFEGKGISYCATCDGFFFRKKRIGIVGSGDYMLKELEVLRNFSDDIIVFSSSDLDIKEKVVKDEIVEFTGAGVLKSIITNNNSYEVDAAFIAVGSQDTLSLAKHLGLIVDEKGDLIVTNSHTNISGIFAGGDCTQGVKQIVKAAADGCIAAYEIK